MARYDITGIGINLREVTDDNGDHKLKVLGLILDGPAHSAGVRQVDKDNSTYSLSFKLVDNLTGPFLFCFLVRGMKYWQSITLR
jgi:hypothetical protein